ncbi:HTH_Tnp_Tc3_2 domain-containing protein [Trichonephila inaurata madagascariensis]|uniref:HTH_Tnp_Tc3_2 domain-containing protein n=1 Tax=Trichonephila inaurata madagascariensis TaxID=2747483 RepID=A0A8X6XV84_9ARAC|nr:HTH_Tnp_Tc3_2 domain-containing protein [Trichonephila inaurata madagascariensis]
MHNTGSTRSARTPELEEHVFREFEEQPKTSTGTVSAAANVNHMKVWRVLGAEDLRPYHTQRVHALKTTDHQARVDFSRWILQRLTEQPDFAAHVLLTDECSFSREGILNAPNAHI